MNLNTYFNLNFFSLDISPPPTSYYPSFFPQIQHKVIINYSTSRLQIIFISFLMPFGHICQNKRRSPHHIHRDLFAQDHYRRSSLLATSRRTGCLGDSLSVTERCQVRPTLIAENQWAEVVVVRQALDEALVRLC